MRRVTCTSAVLSVLVAISIATPTLAGECKRCGGSAACQQVCRLVCEEKKVEVTCWSWKEEEFCIPGPSKPGSKHCEEVCEFCEDGKDSESPVTKPKKFVWTEWIPGRAKIHTKKELLKRTVTKTIPSYKWVVEDLCEKCAAVPPTAKVASALPGSSTSLRD